VAILNEAGFIRVQQQQKAYCKRDEQAILDYVQWLGEQLPVN
jgi:hypothetical protein